MNRLSKWTLIVILLSCGATFAQHSRIFPQPQKCVPSIGIFDCHGILVVQGNEDLESVFDVLKTQFEAQNKSLLEIASGNAVPDIYLSRTKFVRDGFYRLDITTDKIEIVYSDQQGLFYAFQSLLQQMTGTTQIACVSVEDWPSMSYRGVHLDCARHFFTIQELKGFIDQMARLKFNKFHWHLTDDQGWRLEIKKYPKLTEIGGWRDSTLIGHFSNTPAVYEHKRYGGFYTQEEAKELVKYALLRGIEIIPEIEMPGHARAALAAYPELGCTGIQQGVVGTWGVFDDVFCSKEETLTFLENVLDEVVAIFPSKTIHVGGDESPKVRWEVCPACQKQIKDHGLHNEHELQSFVIQRMSKFLTSKGRTLMGWDEILEGGLAENAQVMSWRGTEGGIAAAKAGHQVVMTPTSYCYFDYYQSGNPGEPLAIGGYLPLEKVYAFQPVPKELSESERPYILGGQANLWTEYLPTMDAVYYMEFPRLVAMAEVLWTNEKNKKPYIDFVQGLVNYEFPYFDKMHINYSTACLQPVVEFEKCPEGIRFSASTLVPGSYILMNLGKNNSSGSDVIFPASEKQLTFPVGVELMQGDHLLRTDNYWVTTHMALGKEVNFKTPPSEKYNVHGNLGLTDGVEGQKPWKGNQWLGFEEDTVQFDLDLGKKTKFGSVSLGVLNDPGSWIYAPQNLKIEYSTNGKKWKSVEDIHLEQLTFFEAKEELKARFLRFTVINLEKIPEGLPGAGFTPWTFLDELIITR